MWLKENFDTEKVVIGMVHLPPLPGTPLYDDKGGVKKIVEWAERDVAALQEGGIHAVMFCNENDRPYAFKADPVVVSTMSSVIGQLKSKLHVPFGVDVLWDPVAAIAIAHATGALFVREVLTGTYASDMGVWNTSAGEALRYRKQIGSGVKVLYNINAEFAYSLDRRSLVQVAKSVAFGSLPDALCVSGPMTGHEVAEGDVQSVKEVVGDVPVFVNTGVRRDNIRAKLAHADGCIVGTGLKYEGNTWNPVDVNRVKGLMDELNGMLQVY